MKTEFEKGQLATIERIIADVKTRIYIYKQIKADNDPVSIEKSKKKSERVSELNSMLSNLIRYQKLIEKR